MRVTYRNRFIAHEEAVKRGPNKGIVSDDVEQLLIDTMVIEDQGRYDGRRIIVHPLFNIGRCQSNMGRHGSQTQGFREIRTNGVCLAAERTRRRRVELEREKVVSGNVHGRKPSPRTCEAAKISGHLLRFFFIHFAGSFLYYSIT